MLSMISILAGPFLYLSIVQNIGEGGAGPSFKMPKLGMPDWLESGSEQVMTATDMGGDSGGSTVYKWKDATGVWQFTNELPVGVTGVETMQVTPGTTVQAFKLPAEPGSDEAPAKAKPNESLELDLMPTPGRVKQLIDDAKNVQTMLDERAKQMDSLSSE